MSRVFDVVRCEEIMSRYPEIYNLNQLYEISDEAGRYEDSGDAELAAMWRAVHKAFSLGGSIEDDKCVLSPSYCRDGRESDSLESFTEDEFLLYAGIACDATEYRLKARMSDILWRSRETVKKKVADCDKGGLPARLYEYACMAADAYSETPLNAKSWFAGATFYHYRLCTLLRTVFRNEPERLKQYAERVLLAMRKNYKSPTFVHELSVLAMRFKLFAYGDTQVRDALVKSAEESESFFYASLCYAQCKEWSKGNLSEQARFDKLTYEAELKHTGYNETLRKVLCMNKAINCFRTYKKEIQEEHGLDVLIERFTLDGVKMRLQMLNEMQQIQYTVNVPSLSMETVFDGVESFMVAMEKLADLLPYTAESEVADLAASTPGNLIGELCQEVRVGDNGNIITPCADADLLAEMRAYRISIALKVSQSILPALLYIREHYGIDQDELMAYIGSVRYIGDDRALLHTIGVRRGVKGCLYEGLTQLVFPLEQTLRNMLFDCGIAWILQKPDGEQQEKGLSALLTCDQLETVLPDGALYDMKALFGANLNIRNRIAHGLIKNDEVEAAHIVYAWWYLWKLIVDMKRCS